MTLAQTAAEIVTRIAPYCDRVEIAGSIRRGCERPDSDIEIVAIPKNAKLAELQAVVNFEWGTPQVGKFPSLYTRVRSSANIDFFWATPSKWGMLFFIRTGDQGFVTEALTHLTCILHRSKTDPIATDPIATLEEQDVFDALGIPFVEPHKRTGKWWRAREAA